MRKHENMQKKIHVFTEFFSTLFPRGLQFVPICNISKISSVFSFPFFVFNDSSTLFPKILATSTR